MDNAVVQSYELCFKYPSLEINTLERISLEITKGEFVAIVGHNGSGKSTFAKHINALNIPNSGKMYTAGMDTSVEENVLEIRKNAGIVFQNPDNQIVATVVEEDVAFGPENLGYPQDEIRSRVDNALNIVNMSDFALRSPHMLSGGQKQRVAIAGVLAMNPDIIVFDESTAMLDPVGRSEVMDSVRYLHEVEKKTIILITHFMDEAILADKVFVFTDGRLLDSGAPSEVFSKTALMEKAGLIPPFAMRVSAELSEMGFSIKPTIDEEDLVNQLCQSVQNN